MDHFIDFNAKGALEDRQLQDSWKAAQSEYNRYHSLKRAGEGWIQLLTTKELDQVKRAMGLSVDDDVESVIDIPINTMKWEVVKPQKSEADVNGVSTSSHDAHAAVVSAEGIQESMKSAADANIESEAFTNVLDSIQDEATKNLVMAWYHAGYHTGYFEGQRSVQPSETGT